MDMNPGPANRTAPLVAHVRCVTGFGGGPDKSILNTPRLLTATGYDSLCVYLHPPADPGFVTLERRAAVANAPLVSLVDRGPWDWRVVAQLVRLCRTRRVAIWHGHDYKSDVLGLIVRRCWPMKLATTLHGWVENTPRMPLYNAIDRWAIRRYDEVMCVSQKLWQECVDRGVPTARCTLVRNGIQLDDYPRTLTVADAKRACGADGGRMLIGAVGRLSPEKGFDRLIRAASELLAEGRELELWIAGEGDERGHLEQLIATLGCDRHVRLLGHVAAPQTMFQACDIFVLSSLSEGLPNVVLEAMAYEIPVIATRVGEIPFVLTQDVDGLIVPPDSAPDLAAALRVLLDDPERRRRLAREGRRTVETSFSFADRIAREASVYDRLLGRGGDSRNRVAASAAIVP